MKMSVEEILALTKELSTEKMIEKAIELLEKINALEKTIVDSKLLEKDEKLESLQEAYWIYIRELQKRRSSVEWQYCKQFSDDENPVLREISADILGRFDFTKENSPYYDESVLILSNMLDDKVEDVVISAGYSLGNLLKKDDNRAVAKLCILSNHQNDYIRKSVVHGLMGNESPQAISTLLKLCKDNNFDIRDWATFAIGSQIDLDTPEIRAVLHSQLDDDDVDVRGEALVGLAERQDFSILDKLKQELSGNFEASYAIEASLRLADNSLLPYLNDIQKYKINDLKEHQKSQLTDAIQACSK